MKVGKLLQSRRKTDLYETVTHFTAHEKDPAAVDAELLAKLSENQKKRTRISDVIEKFVKTFYFAHKQTENINFKFLLLDTHVNKIWLGRS